MSAERSQSRHQATIEGIVKAFAAVPLADEKEFWAKLPRVFLEVTGRLLDANDQHDIMLCQEACRRTTPASLE